MGEHGSYKLELKHNLIIVRLFSSWNRQTAERMCADFMDIACTISGQPWACLVDLLNWELGGPEVMETIVEVNHWCAKNNQKMEAVVCSSSIQAYFLKELQKALPDTESAFFAHEGEAIQWLKDHGFGLS